MYKMSACIKNLFCERVLCLWDVLPADMVSTGLQARPAPEDKAWQRMFLMIPVIRLDWISIIQSSQKKFLFKCLGGRRETASVSYLLNNLFIRMTSKIMCGGI